MAREVVAVRMAMHGDKKDVEKALKDWMRD